MYIADLHIHSHYSRATSKDCSLEYLDLWARKKGIAILGTGDFTHPAWREELKEKLVPAEEGLYILKEEYRLNKGEGLRGAIPRFVVSGEISSIYKKNGKVRKVHSVLLLPGIEEAKRLSERLETIGNLHSDGRPILGLDCHDLLEITLEMCPRAIYIPAHIWTPHFSLFGAFSGFDSIEECFEDLTPYVHALETGLSADPPMIWRLSALDRFQLVSNSDAHSPSKLGREANLLNIELSYTGLWNAIQKGEGLEGTVEFFPEEGKYHYDGHRKCNLCLSPLEAKQYSGKCPVCGRKLTTGVSHRIGQLADRAPGFILPGGKSYENLVPLNEVIAASTGYTVISKKVQSQYESMIRDLGSELLILRDLPLEDINHAAGYMISEGIKRLREGIVSCSPGYDGEYGTIRLFEPEEIDKRGKGKGITLKEQEAGWKKKDHIRDILETLDQAYGVTKEGFYHQHHWQLLAAIMLSAQSTDKQVNQVLPQLFLRFQTVEQMAEASLTEIEESIRSIGLYKNKAKNLKKCCKQIAEEFGGQVPRDIDGVLTLAGVGRKTATLFLADAYAIPGITVDTHVFRISRRLGWAMGKTPEAVEMELQKILPKDHWNRINFQLIYHGRAICTARKAKCGECMLRKWCGQMIDLDGKGEKKIL